MEKLKNHIKNFTDSKKFNYFVYGLLLFIFTLFVFRAGVSVGYHKANFSYKWGDNYKKFFEMRGLGERRQEGFETLFGGVSDRRGSVLLQKGIPENKLKISSADSFMNAHGMTGKILVLDLPNIIISDKDGIEKAIIVDEKTLIMHFREKITFEDLREGDDIIVLGSPSENGEVVAKIIRIIPN